MNKNLFLIIFSMVLLFPAFSHAICTDRILPCGYDMDGDGTVEMEVPYKTDNNNIPIKGTGNLNYNTGDEDPNLTGDPDWEGCQFCDIFVLGNNIMVYIMTCLAPIVIGLMLILGGFYVMISGVDPEKLKTGKSIITSAIIGLVVIFTSWVIINTFLSTMGIATWTGLRTWWQFKCY